MTFTSTEKQAIVSVLLAIMNADGTIDIGEILYYNQLKNNFQFSDYDFNRGKELNAQTAMAIISSMNDAKKIAVGMMMQQMIESDGNTDSAEIRVFNTICILAGITDALERAKR